MSAADELRDFLAQHQPNVGPTKPQEPATAPPTQDSTATLSRFQKVVKRLLGGHSLKWEPGAYGKAFFSDGSLHTWPVDQNYEPNHADYGYLSSTHWQAPYLFIHPDGRAQHYGIYDDESRQRLHSVPQIDRRLTLMDEDDEW